MTDVDPPAVGPRGSEERPREPGQEQVQPPRPPAAQPATQPATQPGERAPDPFLEPLRRFVAETFRAGDPTGLEPDTPLVTSGIVDSVGVLELVDFLHTRFGVQVPPAEVTLEHFDSLARLAALVASLGGPIDSDRGAGDPRTDDGHGE